MTIRLSGCGKEYTFISANRCHRIIIIESHLIWNTKDDPYACLRSIETITTIMTSASYAQHTYDMSYYVQYIFYKYKLHQSHIRQFNWFYQFQNSDGKNTWITNMPHQMHSKINQRSPLSTILHSEALANKNVDVKMNNNSFKISLKYNSTKNSLL